MIIATGADDRYAMPLCVSLYSALANLEDTADVSLYIIDGGISEKNKHRLTRVLTPKHLNSRLHWVTPDLSSLPSLSARPDWSNDPEHGDWLSQATFLRILIPNLLPEQCERAIYLDSDLVVEANLKHLWEEGTSGRLALAVQDYSSPFASCPQAFGDNFQILGLRPDTPYCNAGVMVMDLKGWRAEKIPSRVFESTRKHQFFRWSDQDGINAIIGDAWGLLNPKWNVNLVGLGSYGEFLNMSDGEMKAAQEDLLRNPFILHFAGRTKPWHFVSRARCRSRFFHYLKESQWFGAIEDMRVVMKKAWEEQNSYDEWIAKSYTACNELMALIPKQASFILVDQSQWGTDVFTSCQPTPFLEKDGQYWGLPQDDETAICALERLRCSGNNFMAFGFPAFWMLEHYSGLHQYLRKHFQCVLENDRLIVFNLCS
jgi:lipopolysaccharide biosynthesis glycosyltransferase